MRITPYTKNSEEFRSHLELKKNLLNVPLSISQDNETLKKVIQDLNSNFLIEKSKLYGFDFINHENSYKNKSSSNENITDKNIFLGKKNVTKNLETENIKKEKNENFLNKNYKLTEISDLSRNSLKNKIKLVIKNQKSKIECNCL